MDFWRVFETSLDIYTMVHSSVTMREACIYLLLAVVGFLSAMMQYLHTVLAQESPDEIEAEAFHPQAPEEVVNNPVEMIPRGGGDVVQIETPGQLLPVEIGDRRANRAVPSSEMPLPRYYAVVVDFRRGIYTSWEDCKPQVTGFRGNKFKSLSTRHEAEEYLAQETSRLGRARS